jgi:RNA polymerase subunit RPABC4/transcription elongation factor Spt4
MKFPEMDLLMIRYCKRCGLITNDDTVGCPKCIKEWFKEQKVVEKNDP